MKGLAMILPAVQIMVAIGFTLGLGLLVLSTFGTALSSDVTAQNAVNTTIVAISNITTNLGTAGTLIGIVAIVAVAGYALYSFIGAGASGNR